MAQFTEVRVARKPHVPYTRTGGCSACLKTIEVGQTYARCTATPWDEDMDSPGWKHMKVHHPYESCT